MAIDIFKYLQPVSGQARECREATNHLVVAVNNIVNSAYVSTYSLLGYKGGLP